MSTDKTFPGDHFSKQASDYSLYRPHYPQSLFKYLASQTPQHDVAWDCATGNGQAAVTLASLYKSIEATDASEKQIEQAMPHPHVRYQVCEATSTPFAENTFDLITVAQALHWFELDKFYNEVIRVSKPGCIFAAWCYSLFSINNEADPVIHDFYHNTIGPYWPEERSHIDAKYETLPFPFERMPSPRFAISIEWNLQQVLGYMGTWSAVQYYKEQNNHDPVKQLTNKLKATWGDPGQNHEIRWPIYLHIGRVNK
jgi:ubiquinone/menaquinone biosynthesis C-methylase UbiE